MLTPVNLLAAANAAGALFEYIPVGTCNGQVLHVLQAEKRTLDFHTHGDSDELFYVIEGEFALELDDGPVPLRQGEMIVVPRGTRHRPVCTTLVKCLLMELDGTLNPGNTGGTYQSKKEPT